MSNLYTLDETVDLYLAQRQIEKKKYYASYLIQAKFVWRYLFQHTLFSVQSEWMPLKKGSDMNYVDLPQGMTRFFSASIVDDCDRVVTLYYNNKLNVVKKPKKKSCGCVDKSCECGGLCEDVNNMIYTTKLLFTINGTDYYEKTWLKLCSNGDINEYREVPTKKYNTYAGDGSDYMNDYNDDYNTPPPNSDYTVVTQKFQKTLCKLDVEPCGCPKNTESNERIIYDFCGCYLPNCSGLKARKCERDLGNINNNCLGEVKISECNTKLYFKPLPKRKLPDYILVNFQTSGEDCNSMIQVPDIALDTMFYGIDYYSKRFNNMFNSTEKELSKYAWINSQNQLILDLGIFSLEELSDVQDAKILY